MALKLRLGIVMASIHMRTQKINPVLSQVLYNPVHCPQTHCLSGAHYKETENTVIGKLDKTANSLERED